MKPSIKYWIFLAVVYLIVFGVIFASIEGAWLNLNEAEQAQLASLFQKLLPFPLLGAVTLCLILGFLISLLFHYYIIPILKLGESTLLISAANPQHRIKIKKGAREIHYLTGIINDSADAFARLQRDVNLQIAESQAKLNEERTRLAALMSEMPHGVLVCNTDGQILLYNQQTQQLFKTIKTDENQLHGILGLGRSIFSLLDRDPIVHALELLHNGNAAGQSNPTSNCMMTLHNGICLRVNMAPVYLEQNETRAISGFVLTLQDMTKQIEADNRRDMLIQSLTDDLQGTLQIIRSSISNILNQPRLDHAQLTIYRRAIKLASKNLQDKIEQARVNYAQHLHNLSKTEDVLAANLLEVIQKNIHSRSSIKVHVQATEGLWLKLDSYSMVQAISHLSGMLQGREQTPELLITVTRNEQQEIELAIIWPEQDVDLELLQEWKSLPLLADNQGKMLTFRDVIMQMGGSIKTLSYLETLCSGILVTFPAGDATEQLSRQVSLEHRPVSYEFDLFKREAWQELGQTPLEKLTYVVFDTETTGLNPSDGDEIIQLGAIRIVNGQLLPHESIDQLVDPKRHVPASSVAIHGIDPALLPGQPTIDKILPHFHKFAENSVLVAHNAAFDMRFLQLQEEKTGIRFTNPVLDTLLLSSVIHPHQDSHALEGLAERLNVTIVGRHTALGDAIVTAEVLLKMIPLLKANGIHTLADAIKAASTSRFAKVNY